MLLLRRKIHHSLCGMSVDIPQYPVPLWRLFLRMGGWIVLILSVILAILTLVSSISLSLAQRFEEEGLTATATVTERYTTVSRDSEGRNNTSHWLGLRYVIVDGQEVETKTTVNSVIYRQTQVGDRLDLLYLRSQPETIETNPGSNLKAARVLQIMAFVMGVVWLISLWIVGGWAVAAVRARRYGTRKVASVEKVEKTAVKINRRARFRLVWRDGEGRMGKSLLQKHERLASFQPGDHIRVYQGVKNSWWVGDVGDWPEKDR